MSREEYQDHLHDFIKHVGEEARRRGLAVFVAGASSTHVEFSKDDFPEWSCLQPFDADGRRGFRIKAKKGVDDDRFSSSLHVIFSIRDVLRDQLGEYESLCASLERILDDNNVEVIHESAEPGAVN